ncbi:MAG: hypothetical protein IPN88_11670 [Bacteroidetes bacterium]|nr:hypothetical protein [Bacteroidota bacterium]
MMRKFLLTALRFVLIGTMPLLILLVVYIKSDPFKVLYNYDEYYDTNDNGRVGLNKDYVSSSTFLNNSKRNKHYDSFIFGSSRSIFYQISHWKTHLPINSNCFHFDASNETLYAMNKKVEFLDGKGVKIKNALVVFDHGLLSQDKSKSGHLFMISPALVGDKNMLSFQLTFFKAFLSTKFLRAYLDFKLSGEIKPYMRKSNLLDDTKWNYNMELNELSLDYFEELMLKNEYYTPERMASFYERENVRKSYSICIGENQKMMLMNMKKIFDKHQTSYRIVISPLYDQLNLNEADVTYLKTIFGEKNVYDFSGINKFTSDYKNYYESSHYRPKVANEIMDSIYLSK